MIKYWLLMPINLAVLTLACILAPVLPLTAIGRETLPNWLSWFQTPDAPLDGDSGFNNPVKHPYITKMPQYIRRVLWLWRNPSYGFNWTVLASDPLPSRWSYCGDLDCDKSKLTESRRLTWIMVRCGKYFHFRWYWKYPMIDRCIQLNMGWNMHIICVNGVQKGVKAKYRFTPHPFRSI